MRIIYKYLLINICLNISFSIFFFNAEKQSTCLFKILAIFKWQKSYTKKQKKNVINYSLKIIKSRGLVSNETNQFGKQLTKKSMFQQNKIENKNDQRK